MNRKEAEELDFPVFNNCPHYCIEVPLGNSTISVRTPNGKKITFAFCAYQQNGNPRCVDIQQHNTELHVKNGPYNVPVQDVSVRGPGPLLFVSKLEEPATLVTISLGK